MSPIPQESGLVLQAENLKKVYRSGQTPALDGFNLCLEVGEFFGLLGPNGAGKTTAISIFAGLLQGDSGCVKIQGCEYKTHKREIREKVGLVPQDLALYEGLSGRENLRFFGRLCGLSGDTLEQRVRECLEFARLTEQANHSVSTYSGGMKRRLNLAAGLLHRPHLLLLDEPTVGVDAQSRRLIHEQLRKLNARGTTIIYTTHYMEEAQELCSRLGIIDGGKIITLGTFEELLARERCHTLEELFLHLTGKQLRDVR